jgi:hypothetical protein
VPATIAASPVSTMLESQARSAGSNPLPSAPPAPAPVPYPFEGNWGREPAPLAPIPPALAPQSAGSQTTALIVLIAIVLAVSFGGCVVCTGLVFGLLALGAEAQRASRPALRRPAR